MQNIHTLRNRRPLVTALALVLSVLTVNAEDVSKLVRETVERSTLDQPGTRPFHLKADYAPSRERDDSPHLNGEVEIWWQSPTTWRQEVRAPEFHQIEIVDGAHRWQKNEGDYYPEWLRELAVAIVRPVPLPVDVLVRRVQSAEVRHMRFPPKSTEQSGVMVQTNIDWDPSGPGDAPANGKGHIALEGERLFYTGGPGWSGEYHDFKDFHGRMVAYTVGSGNPEVTAKVRVLEDLGPTPAGFFDADAPGGDPHLLATVVLDEAELQQNLLPGAEFQWPPLADGPLEGTVGIDLVLDRTGKVREMTAPVADNAGVNEAAEQGFRAMQFRPVMHDGVAVQATGHLAVHFKTVRPPGVETLDSALHYFELGRKTSCLGAGASAPYMLRAEFQAADGKGGIATGRYEDTWLSETQWKREAWFGSSHLVRSQIGEKHYVFTEGAQAQLLRLVMIVIEPIPASDTMTESDWRIRRDTVDGLKTIRVVRGPESTNGVLETGNSQGFWFDESGKLVKTYTSGFEIRPADVQAYGGVEVARRIDVVKDGKIGMRFIVKEIGPADPAVAKSFQLKGHEWERAFTAEVR